MIILGIDPGTVRIGYGFIEKRGGKLIHLESGLIKLAGDSHLDRLVSLEKNLDVLLQRFQPDKTGIEKLFFVKNRKTAFSVAEARGIILKLIAEKTITLKEVTPREVKLAVTGDGGASKQAVARMVRFFLSLNSDRLIDDVTDALAVAIAVA